MHITLGGIVFLVAIVLLVVIIILVKRWRKTGSFNVAPSSFFKGTSSKNKQDNVVIIDKIKGIYSEYWEEKLLKDYVPQLYRNNNKEYAVLLKHEDEFTPYYPNDTTKYFAPDEWAQVLQMKANEELFKKRNTLYQHISVWALVAGMGIAAIIFVIT